MSNPQMDIWWTLSAQQLQAQDILLCDDAVRHSSGGSNNVTADVTCKHCIVALCLCVTEFERLQGSRVESKVGLSAL